MKKPVTVDITQSIEGRVWKYGDHVNTDVIFPGKYTYTKYKPEEIIEHALEDLDPSFAPEVEPGDVVVGGWNWGCGSSREQAATCLRYSGVGAVVAKSFSRIFFRNAINQGLLAIVCPAAVDGLEAGDRVKIDFQEARISGSGESWGFEGAGAVLEAILLAGGLISYTLERVGKESEL